MRTSWRGVLTALLLVGVLIWVGKVTTKNSTEPKTSLAALPAHCSIPIGAVLSRDKLASQTTKRNTTYKQKFVENFDFGVLVAHIWDLENGSQNSYDWALLDKMVDFVLSGGKFAKLHALVWHKADRIGRANDGYMDWYEKLPSNQARRDVLKSHIQTVIAR